MAKTLVNPHSKFAPIAMFFLGFVLFIILGALIIVPTGRSRGRYRNAEIKAPFGGVTGTFSAKASDCQKEDYGTGGKLNRWLCQGTFTANDGSKSPAEYRTEDPPVEFVPFTSQLKPFPRDIISVEVIKPIDNDPEVIKTTEIQHKFWPLTNIAIVAFIVGLLCVGMTLIARKATPSTTIPGPPKQ